VRLVIQRVSRAMVRVQDETVGSIGVGLLVLVGLERGDSEGQLDRAAHRVASLRIFEDDAGKMNRGLDEIGGAVLAVSQFTLAGSLARGRRPSFVDAMGGAEAEPMFDKFVELLRSRSVIVETGTFGAMMEVELVNDGPVTLLWEDRPEG